MMRKIEFDGSGNIDYVGLSQAAEMLGISQRDVRSLVGRRKLERADADGPSSRPVVSVASVERLRQNQKTGLRVT